MNYVLGAVALLLIGLRLYRRHVWRTRVAGAPGGAERAAARVQSGYRPGVPHDAPVVIKGQHPVAAAVQVDQRA